MKKYLGVLCLLFVFIGTAEAGRSGVQFSSNADLSLIHYGDDFAWAAGGTIGFKDGNREDWGSEEGTAKAEEDTLTFSVFARKNFNIHKDTFLGLGVQASWNKKNIEYRFEGSDNESGTIEVDTWAISPYLILDYHLNDHFILNAGTSIFEYKVYDFDKNGGQFAEADSMEYLNPFMSVTYLF